MINTQNERITDGNNTFEMVNEVPPGYQIWNIGKNMIDGYLPLCRLSARQPFPGGRSIETDTLLAIKCEGAQDILAFSTNGQNTVMEVEQYLKNNKNAKPGTWSHEMVKRMKKALPYMKQIKGL